MKVLVTGSNGQVGWEVARELDTRGEVVALDRHSLDLEDPDRIRALVREIAPRVVINAAAYTAVDEAETDRERAFAVNATAPGILAEEAKRIDALLVHYSTDYVFDGTKAEPYTEDDQPNPINVYGESKLAGERAIVQVDGRYLVLRTSWVYANRGTNFMLKVLRLLRERETLQVVDDQMGAPTWSRLVARVTALVIDRERQGESPIGRLHLTARGQTTWCGFASRIADHLALQPGQIARIEAVPSAGLLSAAKRPLNSRMDCTLLERELGVRLPSWESEVALCLAANSEISKSPG